MRYYFGSKDQLIALAMDDLVGGLETVIACLDDTRVPPKERLRRYIRAYIPLARKHPALFRTFAQPDGAARDTYFMYLSFLYEQCWPKFTQAVGEAACLTDRRDIELKSLQLVSAIEFPVILEMNKGEFSRKITVILPRSTATSIFFWADRRERAKTPFRFHADGVFIVFFYFPGPSMPSVFHRARLTSAPPT